MILSKFILLEKPDSRQAPWKACEWIFAEPTASAGSRIGEPLPPADKITTFPTPPGSPRTAVGRRWACSAPAFSPSQPAARPGATPTPFEPYSAAPTATALAGALIASARKPDEIDERLRLVAAVSLLPEADRAALAAAAEAHAASRRAEPPRQRVLRRSRPRSPDRQASIERRRVHAGSGALPPWIRKRCTQGVAAALTIMADWRKGGRCELPIGKIAGLAGVCHTLAQDAMRLMRLGLGRVTERRQPGRANLTNSVEILDPDWLTWQALVHGYADAVS